MTTEFFALKHLRKSLGAVLVFFTFMFFAADTAFAQASAYIVRNDRGGIVGDRAEEIRRLKSTGRRVEIQGDICLSSCTMYLGAGDVCVNPNTRFGFHGPSYYGKPLPPEYFDYWSDVIAEHYPKPVRDWFMQTGRHRINGYYTIRGTELIRLGMPAC